jgi:DNA primase
MARIQEASVREVAAAADMVEVVSARTQLRRVGARYTGLCPFHEERTPSFSVNAQDKLFYCFGCGKGGDVITFVRETEQLDFADAVEWLAERFRVPLEYEESSPRLDAARRRRERLHALLEQATSFYERYLWESEGGEAVRSYLAERGLREEICREFRLGLAPRGNQLAPKARAKGFEAEELRSAGLVHRRGNDYFSGRLIFPLADARGRVVGLGARRLHEDDPLRAKYVNSPEGELFHKGSILYGLHLARTAITKAAYACVVEGYTDVLALRQAGFEPVVASMGTSLTERQLRELSRLARRVYLCFDADAAGQAATLRGMELATAQGLDVHVVPLPPGLDPADAADSFEDRLAGAERYLHYRVRLEIERAPERQDAFERVREVLARFEDSPERQEAVRLAADRLDLPRDTQAGLAPRTSAGTGTVSPKLLQAGDRLERMFLAACVLDPKMTRPFLEEVGEQHLDRDDHRRLRAFLLGGDGGEDLDRLRAELWATAEEEGMKPDRAKGLALELQERYLERQISALRRSEMTADDARRHAELVKLQSKVRDAVSELA